VVLAVVALALVIVMWRPFLSPLGTRNGESITISDTGVSIKFHANGGPVEVTVDGRTEVIPRADFKRSLHYQEAMRRISSHLAIEEAH
jgi:hypothetical protein